MQSIRLIEKTGLYFIGNMASKILTTILIPIYAFYISTDDLGYYDYAQTIMGILTPIIFLAIWESILRFLLLENDKEKRNLVITTSALFSIVMSVAFIIGITIYSLAISSRPRSLPLISIMFLSYVFAQIWQYYARALGKNKTYVVAGVVGTTVNFIFVVIFICILKMELNGLLLSYSLGQIMILTIIEKRIHVIRKIKFNYFDFGILKSMLLFSTPLVLNLTSTWLITGFGRLIITNKLGMEANGLFSFASRFSLIIIMIGSVVTMAVIEEAIISAKTTGVDSSFARTIGVVFQIFLSIALLLVPVITIFYASIQKTDYFNSLGYAPWLLLYGVATVMSSNIASIFQAIDKTQYQFITSVIGGLVTVGISIILISSLGVYAVIIGQVMGATVMMIARYMLINKFIKFKINWIPIFIMTCLFIGMTILCLNTYIIISFIALIIIIIFELYINRNYLKVGYGFLKGKVEK